MKKIHTRLMLTIAYNGREYLGFQRQKIEKTEKRLAIQNVLEQSLFTVYRRFISIVASGRTDRGVHAEGQIITFDLFDEEAKRMPYVKLNGVLNRLLPEDIRILSIRKISPWFHPRHHAMARHYRYRIICHNNLSSLPTKHNASIWPHPIDVAVLNQYLSFFCGKNDFSTFCSPSDPSKSRERILYLANAHSSHNQPKEIIVDLIGNAFLRSMVRSIVGNVLFLMRKKENPPIIKELLKKKDPSLAKQRACANGLSLVGVFYTPIFCVTPIFETGDKIDQNIVF